MHSCKDDWMLSESKSFLGRSAIIGVKVCVLPFRQKKDFFSNLPKARRNFIIAQCGCIWAPMKSNPGWPLDMWGFFNSRRKHGCRKFNVIGCFESYWISSKQLVIPVALIIQASPLNSERGGTQLVEAIGFLLATQWILVLKLSLWDRLTNFCSAEVNLLEPGIFWSVEWQCLCFGEGRKVSSTIRTICRKYLYF